MGIEQIRATGLGRRLRRGYVGEINRMKKYLPQLYAQRKNQEHQDRMYDLGERSLGIEEDLAHEMRKKNRFARNLGYANIGLGAGLGAYDVMGQPSFSDIGDWFTGGDSAVSALGGVVSPSPGQDFGEDLFTGGGIVDDIFDWGGLFS